MSPLPAAPMESPGRPLLGPALRAAARLLAAAGVPSPQVDAELLAAHLLGISRGELQAAVILHRPAPAGLAAMVGLRAERIPLQHLIGTAPFRALELDVGPGVFVPRPETEQVAQAAIDAAAADLRAAGSVLVVDLCTGSGAIALAVAREVPGATVHAVELDPVAYAWAQRNVRKLGAAAVVLHRADARTALAELDAQVDVVVANPPYLPPDAVPIDREVAEHDPEIALYGLGADGLEVPRGIVAAAARLLRPGGLLVLEHAEVQELAARAMVDATGSFEPASTRSDLTGRARMVIARRTAGSPGRPSAGSGDPVPAGDVEHSPS